MGGGGACELELHPHSVFFAQRYIIWHTEREGRCVCCRVLLDTDASSCGPLCKVGETCRNPTKLHLRTRGKVSANDAEIRRYLCRLPARQMRRQIPRVAVKEGYGPSAHGGSKNREWPP